jgi:chromosome segregation protein
MTAIALLFSTYMVKPSPFCFLDEIDAALDEENVRRFLKMMRQFSQKTQFIIVTHNKKTMTIGSSIYGVTMEEPGVSKLVSMRLGKNEQKT